MGFLSARGLRAIYGYRVKTTCDRMFEINQLIQRHEDVIQKLRLEYQQLDKQQDKEFADAANEMI